MKSLKELLTILNEHVPNDRVPHVHSSGWSPPNILILKRKTVRSYSNTERVALYYNEKLQRYFSVPFVVGHDDDRDDIVGVSEEQINEISVRTAERAAQARMDRANDAAGPATQSKSYVIRKSYGKDVQSNFQKAQTTMGHIQRKIAANDAKYATKKVSEETSQEASAKRAEQVSKTWANRRRRWNDWKAQQNKPAAPKEVKEEVITEDAISHLKKVKEFGTDKPLYHKDGTQTRVDPTTAHALLTVHGALHPDNQKKFSDALEHSKAKFHKVLDFAWKQVK